MSVAAVMNGAGKLHDDGTISWPAAIYGLGACSDTKFVGQPYGTAIYGTAFLVGPELIVTAGHVLTIANYQQRRFVFGPWSFDALASRIHVPAECVYRAQSVLRREFNRDHTVADYSIATLDRPVPLGTYVPPIRREPVADATRVYTLGHSHGLELTFADNAWVTDATSAIWLSTNLDLLPGCSGSPVFDAETHQIVGLVSHGSKKSEWTPRGGFLHLVAGGPSHPEHCTRITQVSDLIPA